MTIQRMDNVGIVVDDLEAAIAFFVELGMELEGKAQIEGPWADRTVGLDGVRCDIAMMRSPDGHGRLALAKYHTPRLSTRAHITRRTTRWASTALCSPSTTSRTSLPAYALAAPSSSARWPGQLPALLRPRPEGIFVGLAEQLS
jgi:Glyoxalase/Bleomycin resistance protein/Dioxygenase superfamily